MKSIISVISLFFFLTVNIAAQSLEVIYETVDPDITWTWNWEVKTDADRLIAVNENGNLYIKRDNSWKTITIDPNNSDLELRGVAIADDGSIWFTTVEHGLWHYDNNEELTNYNSSNSSLPVDKLRGIDVYGNYIWISTDDGEGLIRFNTETGESNHFTESNTSELQTNWNLDPHIDSEGHCWVENSDRISRISPDLTWTSEDMSTYISAFLGGEIQDIHIESPESIYVATTGGVVYFDGSQYTVLIENGDQKYSNAFVSSKGDLWFTHKRTGANNVTVIRDGELYNFSRDDVEGIPSQVFSLAEYQDTVVAVGTIGNNIAKFVFDLPSSTGDLDSFSSLAYPNPAANYLLIDHKLNENLSFSLSNLSGQTVLKGLLEDNFIDVSAVNSGIYFLELNSMTNNKRLVQKIEILK